MTRDRVDIRIEPELKELADKEAKKRGMNLSKLIRLHLKRITGYKGKV